MKIIHITPYFLPTIGGAQLGLYNLCRYLEKEGIKQYIIAPKRNKSEKSYEKMDNIKVYRYAPNKILRYSNIVLSKISGNIIPEQHIEGVFKTIRLIENENIDIIHMHYFRNTSILGYLAKKKFKIPVVIELMGDDIYDPVYPVPENLWRYYYPKILNNCDVITAVSNFVGNVIYEKTGIKAEIIPYGVDTNIFKPFDAQIDYIQEKYNLSKKDKIVIAVQRLEPRKKVQVLLYAAKKVIDEVSNVKFLIIGDGPDRDNLERLTKKLGISRNIIFTGVIPDKELIKCYSLADIFSIHTLHEGLGIVFLEAMAMGLPIVTTYAHGNEDIIENGKNGFMVEPNNPDKLAEKIIYLLNNEEIRRKIGKLNRKEAVEKYDWKNIARRVQNIYEMVLK